jgi:hypothetical protein
MDVSGGGLWLALGLGAAFGFFLERAGLGNSVKLAAQFYLRDLAVFKVMFTAIVTAMLGLLGLSAAGWLDIGRIEVPATFLLPQLVGGVVFGVGFLVGGYCPGTGCVALASGRLDGLAVIAGMSAGVLVFGEAFDALRGFYVATPLGPATLPTLLHVPHVAVAAAATALAAGGFVLVARIERRLG